MKRLRLAWAGVAAAVLIGVAVLIAVALNVGRTSPERDAAGPAVSGDAPSPQTEVSSEAARGETQEPSTAATDTESADASGTVSPGDEEEVVLTDPLGGAEVDPSVAEAFPDFARVLGKDDIRPIYAPVLVSAEVAVNDRLGEVPLLVYANSETRAAHIYVRRAGGRELEFAWRDGALTDVETGSTWDPGIGRAVEGELRGEVLKQVPHATAFDWAWADFYPDTAVYGQ